jgi:hypothetical protein
MLKNRQVRLFNGDGMTTTDLLREEMPGIKQAEAELAQAIAEFDRQSARWLGEPDRG